jgi:hypothetical protein
VKELGRGQVDKGLGGGGKMQEGAMMDSQFHSHDVSGSRMWHSIVYMPGPNIPNNGSLSGVFQLTQCHTSQTA